MSMTPVHLSTKGARFTLLGPDLLEQRFLPVELSPEDLAEMAQARKRLLQQHGSSGLMLVVPSDVPLRPDLMDADHYRDQRNEWRILAMAIVADGEMLHAACRIYFIYHPQPFPAEVFEEDHDALRWLREQMNAIRTVEQST